MSAAPTMVLEIRNLRIEVTVRPPGEKPRDILIVDDVSLTLQKGRVLGLIGESGAGKSTVGLSALGYGRGGVRITGGEVWLNGRDILQGGAKGLRALRGREVSYVAQSAAAAFNPSHRLMKQVVETMAYPIGNRPSSAPSRCSASWGCQTQRISASAFHTRFRAGSCSVP